MRKGAAIDSKLAKEISEQLQSFADEEDVYYPTTVLDMAPTDVYCEAFDLTKSQKFDATRNYTQPTAMRWLEAENEVPTLEVDAKPTPKIPRQTMPPVLPDNVSFQDMVIGVSVILAGGIIIGFVVAKYAT